MTQIALKVAILDGDSQCLSSLPIGFWASNKSLPTYNYFPLWFYIPCLSYVLMLILFSCNGCADERDDMTRVDSDKFQSIINEVDKLQNLGRFSPLTLTYFFYPFSYNLIGPVV